MKKIIVLFCMLVSFSLTAEEIKMYEYYNRGEVTVTDTCPAHPVLEMIQAFLDDDLDKAKTFGTEKYSKYVKYRKLGWEAELKEFKNDWDRKEPIQFRFETDEKKAGDFFVNILYKNGSDTFEKTYRVRKIDGQYKILPR